MPASERQVEERRTPWSIWWSLVAGFLAWGFDLGFSYVIEQHSCSTGGHYLLHLISVIAVVIALSGFFTGLGAFRSMHHHTDEQGGSAVNRTYFQAVMGIIFSLSFVVVVIAGAIPRWILDPCG